MNIVILDDKTTVGNDLHWDKLSALGTVTPWPTSTMEEALHRVSRAEAVFSSKVPITRDLLKAAPHLQFVGALATGFDHVDVEAVKERGIALSNIPAYSTQAVAQHTIGLILELCNRIGFHSSMVKENLWTASRDVCLYHRPLILLEGKTLGIVGYGNIGKKVASMAAALGMEILIYSQHGEAALAADFVSLHTPANKDTVHFINKDTISKMKDGAFLINTARGALIDEPALIAALNQGKLSGFAADVLATEPPLEGDPLVNHPKAIVTPHNSWCPPEIRQRICDIAADNLASFMEGGRLNRIV